jgi:Beta-galactosidase
MLNSARRAAGLALLLSLVLARIGQLHSEQPPKLAWLREGIVASSDMEALTFVLRRGGARADTVQQWRASRTEEAVRKLKAAGVNFAITNLYKGAGIQAENEDIQSARTFTALAHKYGIRVAGYVGSSMMYETMFQEVPEARNWRQQNEFGEPIYYTADQTFRYMACRNNPGYRAYIRKAVRVGIQDIKLDAIHFDQMQWWPEPNSCRCQFCRTQFREFLQKRYPDAQRARLRFGFTRFDQVIPPPYGLHEPPVRLSELHNPMMQEWAEFRAWSLARDFQEFAGYIHGLNPDAAMIANPTMAQETNVGFIYGVRPQDLFATADAIWTEEPNVPQWTPDGRLVSQIRSYKAARAMGKPLFHWQDLDGYEAYKKAPLPVRLAESLAYDDANLGVIAGRDVGDNLAPVLQQYVTFFRSNLSDLVHTNEVADAAILRSFSSIEFNPSVSLFNTVLFEQTLIQTKIPFGLIYDRQLADLGKYKVLVLADQDALSDEQLGRIRAFVEQGGGLVATGTTSLLTGWRTRRGRFGLADLFGTPAPPAETAPNAPMERQFGKGRVVYIPRIEAEVPAPPAQMNYSVRNAAWKLPKNYQQLAAAVRWAAGGELSAEVDAPLWVTAELAEQPASRTRLLHLVNFKYQEPVKSIPVRLRIPTGMRVREVILKSPGEGSVERLEFSAAAGIASLRIPQLNDYALILFRMDPQ